MILKKIIFILKIAPVKFLLHNAAAPILSNLLQCNNFRSSIVRGWIRGWLKPANDMQTRIIYLLSLYITVMVAVTEKPEFPTLMLTFWKTRRNEKARN
ncbi:hypothetical protein NECAME_15636 [Necator americanus]|uniref:Uncharacterized protein n=1 Tax=Necator americanus TaxID=51031 RepID=W2SGS5_NECAM|nr:hypothetical protein NECAME_15636 [Necator americanus]ETN68780.1 hypothetical protein NECAME_15636 [Necator americanus]